jgi:serine/threonine protein kinase
MHGDAARRGATIGRYHLHREIAKGGMARIHIARSVGTEGFTKLFAAKRLDPQLANDAEFVEMFLDEARVASKVRHRNVVPVLDVVTIDGELIMVQELVHGAPLHKVFGRAQSSHRRIPIDIAVAIAAQVLAGLHAAHEAVDEAGTPLHIVHRDVSPQNVMITTDGMARLLDFGVAKTVPAGVVTREGTFKGKLVYSSPEQLAGYSTRQTDIYALGVVLWELLTGKRMHAGGTDAEIYANVMKCTPPRLTQALATQREWCMIEDTEWQQLQALEPIVARALAHDLTERYATAADMERALLDAVEPAPSTEIAAWLRSHVQDLLDQTDKVIAAEEASWRAAKGSGCLPVSTLEDAGLDLGKPRRASTSLETQAQKPSAMARLWQPLALPARGKRGRRSLAIGLADALAILLTFQLLVASARQPARVVIAAPEPTPQLIVPMAVTPAAPRKQVAPSAPRIEPAKAVEKRRPDVRAQAKTTKRAKAAKAARTAECSIPFYYEGNKKRFKPSCI